MDLVRACYVTRCRFFHDSQREVEILWYPAPPGAVALPFPTRFGSGNWARQRVSWPGVGEVLGASRRFVRGLTPASSRGRTPCGTALQFWRGLSLAEALITRVQYDAFGLPACCGAVGLRGGVLGGGVSAFPPLLPGGLLGDSSAFGSLSYVGEGGVAIGGTGAPSPNPPGLTEGGLEAGGIAPYGPTIFHYVAQGGVLIGGVQDGLAPAGLAGVLIGGVQDGLAPAGLAGVELGG